MWKRNLEMIGALGPHNPLSVDNEFIPFGLAAENGMIVENDAGELRTSILCEKQRRGKAADSTTDNCAVEYLACVNGVWGQGIKNTVANLVACALDFERVAVEVGVLADP